MKGLMVTQQSQRLFLFGIVCSTTSVKCTMISHKFSVSVDVLQWTESHHLTEQRVRGTALRVNGAAQRLAQPVAKTTASLAGGAILGATWASWSST
jgi:hypothetical protein